MRRTATWLLVGAVAALGLAAGVDALRDGEAAPAAAPDGTEEPPVTQTEPDAGAELAATAAVLRGAGVSGRLVYAGDDCVVRELSLPDLEERLAPAEGLCGRAASPGNELVFEEAAPDTDLVRRCDGRVLELRLPSGALWGRTRAPGCEVAWRGGTPTFLRRGGIVELAPCPGPPAGTLPLRCTRTLLSRADLRRELGRVGWTGLHLSVEAALWLSETRLVAIVGGVSRRGPAEVLAVFDGGKLVTAPVSAYADLHALRPSPSGAFVAAKILDPGGLLVVDRDGGFVRPAVRHGHALAWSPDERWIAEATDEGVYVFRADDTSAPVHVLPFQAADLAWRG